MFCSLRIRCKVIYVSPVRFFGETNKVFDAIVSDLNGEIKIVGFNEEVDRLYSSMVLNQVGKIRKRLFNIIVFIGNNYRKWTD